MGNRPRVDERRLGLLVPLVWEQYMVHAVQGSLDFASQYPKNIGDQKVCSSAPFHLSQGAQIFASNFLNTIISKSNFSVVTAYPSTNSQFSACNQT